MATYICASHQFLNNIAADSAFKTKPFVYLMLTKVLDCVKDVTQRNGV